MYQEPAMQVEIHITRGRKISPEAVQSLDPAKRGQTAPTPQPQSEVEAQERFYSAAVACPFCSAVNYLWVSDTGSYWYTCWHCQNPFQA